jgi:pimeloyl-ACP methyl ester carboxylesterase
MDTLAGDVVGLMDRLGYRNVTLVGHDWGGVIAWVTIEPSSPPGTFHAADFDRYRQAWAQPGAIMGMLNWYRAFFRRPFRLPLKPRLQMPVLVLWGTQDVALSRELAEASIRLCEDGELVYFEDASHWIQHQEAEKVNQHLLSFFHQRASPI